jgi:hypothetical protein
MKRKIMCIIFAALFTARATAAEKPGIFDALREAARGFIWMVKVEVCKIDMVLFHKDGVFPMGYDCNHKDHREIFYPKK